MSKSLVAEMDAAWQEFVTRMEAAQAELDRHAAVLADYDELCERRIRAHNAGTAYVYEAAVAIHELRELRAMETVRLMNVADARRHGETLQ